jgi:hypothetical protein
MSGLLFREENVKVTEDGKEALIRLSQVSYTAVFLYVHCRNSPVLGPLYQGCGAGAGTGTGGNRIHLGTLAPEPYSEYGSGSGYKEMKQTTKKI